MEKLKECKNLGELYEAIGEDNFSFVAKLLIAVLIASPLFWAIINLSMLLDWKNYNAYTYNTRCMAVMFVIFFVITAWSIVYYCGKIKYNNWSLKQIAQFLRDDNPWLIPWFMLMIWTVIPIICSANILGAITGATFLSAGYITHIFAIGILGCAAMVNEEGRKDLFRSFVWIADFLALVMVSKEYGVPYLSYFSPAGGVSLYTNENHYGYYLAMACLVIMGLYWEAICGGAKIEERLFYIFSLFFNIYVLMVNDTLGAYVGIVLVCIIMTIIWKIREDKIGIKIIVPLSVVLLVTGISAGGLIPCSTHSVTGNTIGQSLLDMVLDVFKIANKSSDANTAGSLRWGIWKDTIEMILEHPIVGHGPDIMYDKVGRAVIDTPHNEYLECAFYLGIPGLILYLSGLIILLINKCKHIKGLSLYTMIAAGAAMAYLISAFFGVRKFNDVCFFFMFMGLLTTKKEILRKIKV